MPTAGFRKMLARTAEGAEFPFPVHPHMPWRLGQALNHVVGFMNLTRWIGVCRPKVERITLLSTVAPSMMNRRGRKMAEGERYVIQPFDGETRLPIQ